MSINIKILIGWLSLSLLPVVLAGQSPEDRIGIAIGAAQAAGVPVSLLESKVQEGLAKGIPMDRIAAAVELRASALERARGAMSPGTASLSAADLIAVADALDAGVSEAVLRALAAAAPSEQRAVAITALAELVARDIAPDHALDRVLEALGRAPTELASLPGQSMNNRRQRSGAVGASPVSSGVTPGAGAARPPAAVPSSGRERGGLGAPSEGAGGPASGN